MDGIKLKPLAISHTIGNYQYYNDALIYTDTSLYNVLGWINSYVSNIMCQNVAIWKTCSFKMSKSV